MNAGKDINAALEAAPYVLRTPTGGTAPMPDLETAVYTAQRLLEQGHAAEWIEIRDARRDVRVGRLYR